MTWKDLGRSLAFAFMLHLGFRGFTGFRGFKFIMCGVRHPGKACFSIA